MYLVIFGLASALGWGASDFIGGLAARRSAALLVTLLSNASGALCLIPIALYFREPCISPSAWCWCMAGGAADAVALVILYAALADGCLLAAPVTALTAAAVPVAVGMLTEGLPKPTILLGLVLALPAVWFLSQGDGNQDGDRVCFADVRMPLVAGFLIGLFLIMTHKGAPQAVFWPMVAIRLGGVAILSPFLVHKRSAVTRAAFPWFLVTLVVVLDISGTAFYILAGQAGRMDVAAVLSSLYPGMTVFLSWLVLHEKLTRTHLVGVFAALGSTMLMTV
ncbi:MAG TPA: DMT family transporter [Geobacteraceae bacterium]|nr:DMT family transporter [Geobacteraceae bacterium]